MDERTAIIKLWDQIVGAVAWSEREEIGMFEFDSKFLTTQWDVSPIMMPLNQSGRRVYAFAENKGSTSTFRGLPGLLADMLPDKYGNALINAWLATQGRVNLTPRETLCFIGKRGMGALEVEPLIREEAKRTSKIELDNLVSTANKILNTREQFQTDLSHDEQAALTDILRIGTSAGGARAKAIIAFNTKTKEVRSGQVKAPRGFTYWILKFDGVTDNQFGISNGYGRVEMAYHLMAKEAGIEMTECQLYEENGRAHFMTRRFDRDDDGNKIHMQSFCAMRHFDFTMVGYFAYEQLFETMRMLGLPYPEAEQMFSRMVFNVLARNCDDHTKNFAFLMDKTSKWKLSPAFDICHAYRPDSPWVSSQSLTINGKRDNINADDLLSVGKQMNIKKGKQIIARVTESVTNWNNYADEVKVDTKLRDAINKTLLVKR
ncbi:MAG: toxin HipA [Bacteroidetes bacterium GWF2_42_66]|nr:MAG: toxin HipA [Bacteroidetes bacterium GWA2_42_15]OFY02816.1 MAG: toxin HipA [Bacteroidetes bacterium GWE2_42_39]OFY44470.1 MAG: toxin HipA [Bacteroidetes bacterium GWF2_42_66]HBL74985.1 toxin HipA [Prolixibacteraceae bacterium]HCR89109.1 toxin HipA [Prolixibacteraceae bacterium]